MIEFPSIFGGLKSINIDLDKANVNINEEGFSLKFKPKTEELPSKEEIKLIEEPIVNSKKSRKKST